MIPPGPQPAFITPKRGERRAGDPFIMDPEQPDVLQQDPFRTNCF